VITTTSNISQFSSTPYSTELTFSLIRYETASLLKNQLAANLREINPVLGEDLGQKKKQGVDDVQMFIEDKYDVRNWDLMDPLQRLTKRIVTTQLAKSRFIASVQTWKTGLDVETKTLMERRAFDDAIKHIRDHRSSRRDENLELPKVHRNMHTVPRCRLNFVSPCQRHPLA
jgi:hypothetical protein